MAKTGKEIVLELHSESRWREIAAVDPQVLLLGVVGAEREEMALALVDDLQDALLEIRQNRRELLDQMTIANEDALSFVEAPPLLRTKDGGHELAKRAQSGLLAHAAKARQVARLDELAAAIVPRLFEADRFIPHS